MRSEITLENVAVIERARAEFGQGFTVLTGETGAGKSILIDSINAILGNRASKDLVRSGAAKASIWARFTNVAPEVLAALEELGYAAEDEELLLSREITKEGKSSCRIGGAPATAAMLRQLCGGLVHIHGQHDNQSLMNPAKHLQLLDAFAENANLRELYRERYDEAVEVQRQIQALDMSEQQKNRKLELLRYEVEEIDAAALQMGEEEELQSQRRQMQNAGSIQQGLAAAYGALFGADEGRGAIDLLGEAAAELEGPARHVPQLEGTLSQLNEMYYNAQEMASDLQGRLADFEYNEAAINQVEERLDMIFRLRQKYGDSVEAVISYGEKAKAEIENITFAAERLEQLQQQQAQLRKQLQKQADVLSASREEAFERLREKIIDALAFLDMPGIVLTLRCARTQPGPTGQDELEFLISTNPGEQPKPMAKIASGGELARIMLAIKSALADKDDAATVIYDEIDTGISGLAAGRIGQMMRRTAKGRQVICVTHTAQIAAAADDQLLIEKNVQDGRTYTEIRPLDEQTRVAELARIVSGDKVTDKSLASAAEMLQLAQRQD